MGWCLPCLPFMYGSISPLYVDCVCVERVGRQLVFWDHRSLDQEELHWTWENYEALGFKPKDLTEWYFRSQEGSKHLWSRKWAWWIMLFVYNFWFCPSPCHASPWCGALFHPFDFWLCSWFSLAGGHEWTWHMPHHTEAVNVLAWIGSVSTYPWFSPYKNFMPGKWMSLIPVWE